MLACARRSGEGAEIVVTGNYNLSGLGGSHTRRLSLSLGLYSLEEAIAHDVVQGRISATQGYQRQQMALAYKRNLANEASAAIPMGTEGPRTDEHGRPYVVTDQQAHAISQSQLTTWTQQYGGAYVAGIHAPAGKAEFMDAIAHNRELIHRWDAMAYEAIDGSIGGFVRLGASTAIAPLGLADVAYSLYSGDMSLRDLAVGGAAGLAASVILHKPIGAISAKLGAAETEVLATSKFVPNPYGKLGGPAHQAVVGDLRASIESRGLLSDTEFFVRTPNGTKGSRFVDVVGIDRTTGLPVEFYQVGKQTMAGNPVAREVRALDDLQFELRVRPTYVPYNQIGN